MSQVVKKEITKEITKGINERTKEVVMSIK